MASNDFADPAFNSITDAIMPILLRHHRETDIATQKKAVLDVLLEFLEASKTLYGEASDSKEGILQFSVKAFKPIYSCADTISSTKL